MKIWRILLFSLLLLCPAAFAADDGEIREQKFHYDGLGVENGFLTGIIASDSAEERRNVRIKLVARDDSGKSLWERYLLFKVFAPYERKNIKEYYGERLPKPTRFSFTLEDESTPSTRLKERESGMRTHVPGLRLSGDGSGRTERHRLLPGPKRVAFKHSGKDNFDLWLLGDKNQRLKPLAQRVGQVADFKDVELPGDGIYAFEVQADGPWEIIVYDTHLEEVKAQTLAAPPKERSIQDGSAGGVKGDRDPAGGFTLKNY